MEEESDRTMAKECMLVVDDDPNMTMMLGKELSSETCEVDIASSIHEAQTMLLTGKYKTVLLDLKFPGDLEELSGLNYIKEIKSAHPKTGVIIITGNSSQQSAIDALNNGADGFILKPFRISEIEAMVEEVLQKSDEVNVREAITAAYFRVGRAYSIAQESLKKASLCAKQIVDEGNTNGVIIEAFIKEQNGSK